MPAVFIPSTLSSVIMTLTSVIMAITIVPIGIPPVLTAVLLKIVVSIRPVYNYFISGMQVITPVTGR